MGRIKWSVTFGASRAASPIRFSFSFYFQRAQTFNQIRLVASVSMPRQKAGKSKLSN
jgi:hypothetical protein